MGQGLFPGTNRNPPEAASTITEKTYRFSTAAYVNSGSAVNAPCKLLSIHGFNLGTGSLYFMVFDSGSSPTTGDTSFIEIIPVASNAPFSFDYGTHGMNMLTGCAFVFSTTSASCTAAGTTPGRVNIQFTNR